MVSAAVVVVVGLSVVIVAEHGHRRRVLKPGKVRFVCRRLAVLGDTIKRFCPSSLTLHQTNKLQLFLAKSNVLGEYKSLIRVEYV